MSHLISRRDMLRTAAVAAGVWTTYGSLSFGQSNSPNEKLNIAAIGVGGRGGDDVNGVAHENLVALCDVDEARAAASFAAFPQAKRYRDFRKMLDEIHSEIDAVVIGTPDHTHAPAGVMAMRMGKHCYCEKPLTHNVYEARSDGDHCAENKLVTQMGTQIHEGDNYRRVVELVQSGAIGTVGEVHVWLGGEFRRSGSADRHVPTRCADRSASGSGRSWIGTSGWDRPPIVLTIRLMRRSTGGIGGTSPTGNWATSSATTATWRSGRWICVIRRPSKRPDLSTRKARRAGPSRGRSIPARGDLPPVTLHWYNGGPYPELIKERNVPQWGSAVLFIGSTRHVDR